MATSRVRHRGQPPADIDHGPSSGSGGHRAPSAAAEVARISAFVPSKLVGVGERLTGGAGAIERRQATEAQREAWRTPERGPSPIARVDVAERPSRPAMGSPEHLQQSRMRGGERTRLIHLAEPPVIPPEPSPPPEELVSDPIAAPPELEETSPLSEDPQPPDDPVGVALWALRDAADDAAKAWGLRCDADKRWLAAQAALEACVRALAPDEPVTTALEAGLATDEVPREAERRHEQLLHGDRDEPAVVSEPGAEYSAPIPGADSSTDDPQVDDVTIGGGPGPVVVRDREASVFAEIVRGGSVMAAAKALDLSDARVRQYVKRAKDEGRLPADVAALIRSRS